MGGLEIRERAVGLPEAAAAASGDACGGHQRGVGVFDPGAFGGASGATEGNALVGGAEVVVVVVVTVCMPRAGSAEGMIRIESAWPTIALSFGVPPVVMS